ncbi:MAG: hypothetical protein MUD10_04000 [Candidatus Pacebacteria bacterium]|nr:hypothetical protein [Candidatus Paceibacterota bacterium]
MTNLKLTCIIIAKNLQGAVFVNYIGFIKGFGGLCVLFALITANCSAFENNATQFVTDGNRLIPVDANGNIIGEYGGPTISQTTTTTETVHESLKIHAEGSSGSQYSMGSRYAYGGEDYLGVGMTVGYSQEQVYQPAPVFEAPAQTYTPNLWTVIPDWMRKEDHAVTMVEAGLTTNPLGNMFPVIYAYATDEPVYTTDGNAPQLSYIDAEKAAIFMQIAVGLIIASSDRSGRCHGKLDQDFVRSPSLSEG